jgi:hypothetical protein
METDLRLRARELIEGGTLPAAVPGRTWGGNGSGQPCSLCGKYIHPNDVEYEFEMSDGARRKSYHFYRFHLMCRWAWQLESARQMHLDESRAELKLR